MIYTGFDGRLTRNPEQGQTQNGTQYVTFNVASDSSRRDQQGNYMTTFVRVTVWGQRGGFVLDHFVKGDPIFVAGELVLNQYQGQNGEQRYSLEMSANNVSFVPQVPKRNQEPQQQPQQGQQGGYQQQPNNYQSQRQNAPQGYQGQNQGYSQQPQGNQQNGQSYPQGQQQLNNQQGNQGYPQQPNNQGYQSNDGQTITDADLPF